MKTYKLTDADFSKSHETIQKIFIKYVTLINDFLNYSSDNLTINDINLNKNNIFKGVQALTHIFKNTLYKTNNIEYTIEITQKCFLYYIEFISQIYDSNGSINLSTIDAIIFIYKKSIFQNIDDEITNKINLTDSIPIINEFISLHNKLLFYYIENIDIYDNTYDLFTKYIYIITENTLSIKTINNLENIHKYVDYCKISNVPFTSISVCFNIFTKSINNTYYNCDDIFLLLSKKNASSIIKNVLNTDQKTIYKFLNCLNN
jgi:hypothetical protein